MVKRKFTKGPMIKEEQKIFYNEWLMQKVEYYNHDNSLKRAIDNLSQNEKLGKEYKLDTESRKRRFYENRCKDYRKTLSLGELIGQCMPLTERGSDYIERERKKIQRRFDEIGIKDFINYLLRKNKNKIYKTSEWRSINYLRRYKKSEVMKLDFINRIYSWSIISELLIRLGSRFNEKEEKVNEALRNVWTFYQLGPMPEDTFKFEDYARMRDAMDRDILQSNVIKSDWRNARRLFQDFCDNTDMKIPANIKIKLNELASEVYKRFESEKMGHTIISHYNEIQTLGEFKKRYRRKGLSDVQDIQLTFVYLYNCIDEICYSGFTKPEELLQEIELCEKDIISKILERCYKEKNIQIKEKERQHLRLRSTIILEDVKSCIRNGELVR